MFPQIRSRYCLIFAVLLVMILAGSCSKSGTTDLKWPKITKTMHPWARWWWMGSAVNKKDLAAVMKDYKAHGLGGLEITPIYGVKGEENRFIKYLSPQWVDMLQYTLEEAGKLDLGIDMDNTTGWPFGGPWVGPADASKTVYYKTYTLKGGQKLREPVQYKQKPMAAAVGHRISIDDIKQPISANKNLQKLALAQVVFPREMPLKTLMGYSDDGKIVNLTNKVDSAGHLNWTAPSGTWTLYAVFEGWHGKMVERAAPGGEGFVIDPFSKKAVGDYLDRFDEAFKGHDIHYLRAFFNDSYEVDDARGQADWTPEFFSEFQKRRGYDLRNHLPALFGRDTRENNARVRADYRETISDLLLDDFTNTWRAWAKSHDAIIRNQAHGSPANILDLYGASDIPETEGYNVIKAKFASSAGHVTGKPLISSESCTWMNEHFLGTLAEARTTVNRFFTGGVNHIFYHGTAYSPPDAPWPGWLFYAAVDFNPSNSFWDDFKALNDYIARCQSFLQKGKPDNDILIYYPIFDYWSKPGRQLLEHFDGSGRGRQDSDFFMLADSLLSRGFTFDFISDRQLDQTTTSGGKIRTGGGLDYKTIILPQCHYIPLKSLKKLMDLAKNGATVIVHKSLPKDVPGLGNLVERQKEFKQAIAGIHFGGASEAGVKRADVGNGHFLLGNDPGKLLPEAGVQRETMVDDSLRFTRRHSDQGEYYFIENTSSKPLDKWVPIRKGGRSVAVFNPETGIYGMGRQRKTGNETEVYLQLKPGGSCILDVFKESVSNPKVYPYYQTDGGAQPLTGTWKVDFVKGGPTLPYRVSTSKLIPWTDFDDPGVKAFSGTARYTITFPKPASAADAWRLDLGEVHESARVKLNGACLDTLIAAPYQVVIPASRLKAQNTLVVEVSNLMANRIAYMDKKGIHWKKFYNVNFPPKFRKDRNKEGLFDASNWDPRSSGLVGPVELVPLKKMSF